MRKFTFILAILLSFAGLAKAQEAENTYDPTTAEGVVPALSTVDGTKFAYYLRSYADASKFLSPYMNEPTTQDKSGQITTNIDEATLVAIVKNGNAFDMYSVNKEGTLVAKWRGDKPYLWINRLTGSTYTTFAIKNVSADNVAYTISNGNKYLTTTLNLSSPIREHSLWSKRDKLICLSNSSRTRRPGNWICRMPPL